MRISQVMSKAVDPIDPTTTIAAAAARMRDEDVGYLLVGTGDRLLGIVTDRDMAVRALAEGKNATREPVWTVMSSGVLSCFEDQPLTEAARIMAEHGVRRLPVLDREGSLRGIVLLSDVHRGEPRRKPWKVTFYKELTDSRGTVHEAPLTQIYVAGADNEGEAAVAARRILKEHWCLGGWKHAADGYRVAGGRRSRPRRTRPQLAQSAVAAAAAARARSAPSHHEAHEAVVTA